VLAVRHPPGRRSNALPLELRLGVEFVGPDDARDTGRMIA
jgi:hypothetical protein